MRRLLLLAVVLVGFAVGAGCGGSGDKSAGYLTGTWEQGAVTANIRVWDFGSRVEGWTDDGRRVSGDWDRIVLTSDVETVPWKRVVPTVYASGALRARLILRQ